MLQERIDKTVYTLNRDGTVEKWYLEKIAGDGTCFLRKSKNPKWIDTKAFYFSDGVYETRSIAIKSKIPSRRA